ncbi:MAG: hypothetical protein IKX92_00015, partial [Clostridia bacterium]|nr:hypothetical protein [Clostridia bacterium]
EIPLQVHDVRGGEAGAEDDPFPFQPVHPQLVDIRIGLTPDDRMMLDYIKHYGIPFIIVATKCDKLSKTKINESANALLNDAQISSGTDIILYSSVTGEGRDTLWRKIIDSAFGE